MRPITSGILAIVFASITWAADASAGTWVLNLEKSQPPRPTKSLVMSIKADGDKESTTTLLTLPDGKERRTETTLITDGKEHPASESGLGSRFDTYTARKVHDHESMYEFTKGGNVVHSVTTTFSKDGKTKTAVMKNMLPNGKTQENTLYFDRQQ